MCTENLAPTPVWWLCSASTKLWLHFLLFFIWICIHVGHKTTLREICKAKVKQLSYDLHSENHAGQQTLGQLVHGITAWICLSCWLGAAPRPTSPATLIRTPPLPSVNPGQACVQLCGEGHRILMQVTHAWHRSEKWETDMGFNWSMWVLLMLMGSTSSFSSWLMLGSTLDTEATARIDFLQQV